MALARREPRHLDWPELFGWPWEEDARTLARRLLAVRGAVLHVEEYQDDEAHVIRAELPGINPDADVDIWVGDHTLHISAERREESEKKDEESEKKDKSGYRSEFRYGAYHRTFGLPAGVREEDVSATYEDGILEVRVKTPAGARAAERKIQVQHA